MGVSSTPPYGDWQLGGATVERLLLEGSAVAVVSTIAAAKANPPGFCARRGRALICGDSSAGRDGIVCLSVCGKHISVNV